MSEAVKTRAQGAVPHAAGAVKLLGREPDLSVRGWMLDDRGAFDEIEVLIDGARVGTADPEPVPGAARTVPWVAGAARAGFAFPLPSGAERGAVVELVGSRGGVRAARLRSLFRSAPEEAIPVPPAEISSPSNGVARSRSADHEGFFREQAFLAGGMVAAASLLERIEIHAGGPEGLRLLDWGCGCGRVTRHLLGRGFAAVSGCDLDGEAIGWCRDNLPGAAFFESEPEPPLPLADASLDVVVGCSVVTHLDAPLQDRWLAELRRVTAPGGLVLLSTQGEFAFLRGGLRGVRRLRSSPPAMRIRARRLRRTLRREGIVDRGATRALEGIAPEGYYRSIAQSPEYTRKAWSAHFEILDQIACGLDGHQDLVVMRRS